MSKKGYIYILASARQGILYIGVTSNLSRRLEEHRTEVTKGFTKDYHIHRLVYFEEYGLITDALEREKHLKHWKRAWKIQLIESSNPAWKDLSLEL